MSDFFATNELDDFDLETGKPGIAMVSSAIQFWSVQNFDSETKRHPSVQATADAFKMTVEDVRAAVAFHYWMFLSGPDDDATKQFIEHEGE